MRKLLTILSAGVVLFSVAAYAPSAAAAPVDQALFTGDSVSAYWEGIAGDRYFMLYIRARDGLFCDPATKNCKRKGVGRSDRMIEVAGISIWGIDPTSGGSNGVWYGALGGQPTFASSDPGIMFDAVTGRLLIESLAMEGSDADGLTLTGSFSGVHPAVTGSLELSSDVFAGFDFSGTFFYEKGMSVGG